MQAITVESLPVPLVKHLQAIICTRHATPVTPLPLLPTAPNTPATMVPWLVESSLGSFVPVKALKPCPPSEGFTHMFEAKSSCVVRMPESNTATTMLLAEVSTSHA